MLVMSELPSELLHAVAQRSCRVALVLGAGCSLEAPTGLRLAREYSLDAYRQLIQDGVLHESECSDPADLSVLASCVTASTGSQSDLVRRLPSQDFRLARPNRGYLVVAALLREQAIDSVLTLNFDLALSSALAFVGATEVAIIPGPQATGNLGGRTVVYLHRNVEELDLEKWILTTEALNDEWREGWQEVIARRTMACPVVVFAGLGSPASVLTETVTRIRDGLTLGEHNVFVVDPAEHTEFEGALSLGSEAHIRLGWGDFMSRLAARVTSEMDAQLFEACRQLCVDHSWHGEIEPFRELSTRFHSLGIVELGGVRARWLLETQDYSPDDARRGLIADLLLGVAHIERETSLCARFNANGIVEFLDSESKLVAEVVLASGSGTLRWSSLEPRIRAQMSRLGSVSGTSRVLVSGVLGPSLADQGPPIEVIPQDSAGDIIAGAAQFEFVSVDDLRSMPARAEELVA